MAEQVKTKRTIVTEGPAETTTTKTTKTYTKTSSYVDEDLGSYYKPAIGPRTTVITRSSYGSGPARGGYAIERSVNYGGVYAGAPSGAYSSVVGTGVSHVKSHREQEKKEMQDLNERLAGYIEKVRFLEAQNRKLAAELEALKTKWGKETGSIKAMYQAELDEARKLLDNSEKEKARLEIRIASLEEQLEEIRKKYEDAVRVHNTDRDTIERQNQQLSDIEAEINLLRRRINSLEDERTRDKKEIQRLTDELNRARIDLDNETLNHIDAENRRQTLEEELEFLKSVHEQELKELAALAYRDPTTENREFWKNEMAQALREIQEAYEEKMNALRGELETFYNLKVSEFRTGATKQGMEAEHAKEEAKRLRTQTTSNRARLADLEARNAQLEKELELLRREYEEKEREWEIENNELKSELAKLRMEMEAMLKELQDIMDIKLSLELEIAAYRKLLEGEENRTGLKTVVEGFMTRGGGSSGGYGMLSSTSAGMLSSSASGGGYGGGYGGFSSGGYSSGGFSSSSGYSRSYGGFSHPSPLSDISDSMKVSQVVKGEMSAKTTYQRSAKGPVTISQCDSDGKSITLENTGKKDEVLDGWTIKRTIDNKKPITYTFPKGSVLGSSGKQKTLKLAAKGQGGDIEASNVDSWGIGANITTYLLNAAGEERATHVQKTVYSS